MNLNDHQDIYFGGCATAKLLLQHSPVHLTPSSPTTSPTHFENPWERVFSTTNKTNCFHKWSVLAEAGKGPASTDSYDNPKNDQVGCCTHAFPHSTSREMAVLGIKPHRPTHPYSLLISPSYVCIIGQRQQFEWTRFQWCQVGTPTLFNFPKQP